MHSKITKRKKKNIYSKKFYKGFKFNKSKEREDSIILFFYEKKYKLITIILFIFFLIIMINSPIFQKIINNEIWQRKKK